MKTQLRAERNAPDHITIFGGENKFARFDEALAGASPLNLPVAAVLTQHRVAVEVYWIDRENSASSRTKRA